MLAVSDDELTAALERVTRASGGRHRLFLADVASAVFSRFRAYALSHPPLAIGYSVKTNPRSELLAFALRHGFYAECISPGEVEAASAAGFTARETVYNGPVPATRLNCGPKYVFADSLESYRACASLDADVTLGVRVRPAGIFAFRNTPGRMARLHRCRSFGRTRAACGVVPSAK